MFIFRHNPNKLYMSIKNLNLLAVLLLCCFSVSYAQKQKITGKITDATTGVPLEGITVRVKLANVGTLSDKAGIYSIDAKSDDVLEISAIGFIAQSLPVNGRTSID